MGIHFYMQNECQRLCREADNAARRMTGRYVWEDVHNELTVDHQYAVIRHRLRERINEIS